MKRDMELVRRLLIRVEQFDDKPSWKDLTEGEDKEEANRILEHLAMLEDEGFTKSMVVRLQGYRLPQEIELTWAGHDFLNTVRDPEIWRKAKERAKSVANVGIAFMWEIAKAEMKAKLGLP